MSRHHKAAKWANVSRSYRERLAPTLPAPCIICGKPVQPTDAWDVCHLTDLARHGAMDRVAVGHRRCNRSMGGKLSAAMRRAPRNVQARSSREARW